MLRIFLTSSHLSSVYMAIYAAKTKIEEGRDILVIDSSPKKKSLLDLIEGTSDLHKWDLVLDQSIAISDTTNLKPGLRKRITRKAKHFPVIRSVYNVLLKKYERKLVSSHIIKLKQELNSYSKEEVSLYMLTQTALNTSLMTLFPGSSINYMEHGIGDYFYVEQLNKNPDKFYCIFKDNFKKYLVSKNDNKSDIVESYITKKDFEAAFLQVGKQSLIDFKVIDQDKKYILILLDAFECYNPPVNFWTDFIDRCLKEVRDKEKYTYLLKPHPNQSNDSVTITRNHLQKLELDFILMDAPAHVSLAAESIYVKFHGQIGYVFSTFSSAAFYLAKFYPDKSRFYILYDFVAAYVHNAPPQYKTIFKGFDKMIDAVFNEGNIKRI